MHFLLRTVLGPLVWAAALYAVLNIGKVSGDWGHGICGPWGCGPPLEALVAWHGFWLVLVALPVVVLVRTFPARNVRFAGLALAISGAVGLVSIAIWQAITWLPTIPEGQPTYFAQRYVFTLATLTDVPLVPVTLAGIVIVIWTAHRMNRQPAADEPSDFMPPASPADVDPRRVQ